jgi:hypothetical protein
MCLLWLFLWLLFILNRGAFPEKLFCGIRGAQRRSGTTRNRRKVDRVPAANFPLSAACRCASYLPSVPSVLPPEPRTQSVMTGSPTFKGNLFLVLCSLCLVVCSLALDDQRQRTKCKVPSPSLFLIVAHFQKNFFVACEVLRGEVARRGIDAKSTESPPPTSP